MDFWSTFRSIFRSIFRAEKATDLPSPRALLRLVGALAVMAELAAVLPSGAHGCFITNCPAGGRKRGGGMRTMGKRAGGGGQPIREVGG